MRINLELTDTGSIDTTREIRGIDNVELYGSFEGSLDGLEERTLNFDTRGRESSLLLANNGASEVECIFTDPLGFPTLFFDAQPGQTYLVNGPPNTVLFKLANKGTEPAPVNLLLF